MCTARQRAYGVTGHYASETHKNDNICLQHRLRAPRRQPWGQLKTPELHLCPYAELRRAGGVNGDGGIFVYLLASYIHTHTHMQGSQSRAQHTQHEAAEER